MVQFQWYARHATIGAGGYHAVLGLALLMALVASGSGALLSYTLDPKFADGKTALLRSMVLTAVGAAVG